MIEQLIIDHLSELTVGMTLSLAAILLILKAQTILAEIGKNKDKDNEGKRIEANAKREAAEAQEKITNAAFEALQETMREQRRHNDERFDNVVSGQRILEGELSEVKEENARQKREIAEMKLELHEKDELIEELQRKNKALQDEVDSVRRQLQGKQDRKPKKQEGGDGNASKLSIPRPAISRTRAGAGV